MKLIGFPLYFVSFIFSFTLSFGQSSRQDEVIDDWVRKIREGPKGHSLSPSWSSKSRIPAIGVGELPLQNEVEDATYQANDFLINRVQAASGKWPYYITYSLDKYVWLENSILNTHQL